jgi:hypothetical protein
MAKNISGGARSLYTVLLVGFELSTSRRYYVLCMPIYIAYTCMHVQLHIYSLLNDICFFFFLVAHTLGSLLPLLKHRAEFPQFLDQGQSVGLLGRVISSSQISV